MTKKAIVFDNSGTLLERFRVIKDVSTGELITHVNSLDLIDTCLNAALVVLQFNTSRLKDLDPNTLISDFVLENNIEFDISYYSTDVSKEEITAILEKDTAVIKDITDTFPLLKERVPQMELCNGSAVIIDIAEERIAYTITSAGQLFSGVKDTIAKLQDKDIDVFIASGDRSGAIKKLANTLETGRPVQTVDYKAEEITENNPTLNIWTESDADSQAHKQATVTRPVEFTPQTVLGEKKSDEVITTPTAYKPPKNDMQNPYIKNGAPPTKRCANCGKENPSINIFCGNCGNRL